MLDFGGNIVEDLGVELPRPRQFSDKAFVDFYADVVSRFHTMRKASESE
jgi:hypothetical protein